MCACDDGCALAQTQAQVRTALQMSAQLQRCCTNASVRHRRAGRLRLPCYAQPGFSFGEFDGTHSSTSPSANLARCTLRACVTLDAESLSLGQHAGSNAAKAAIVARFKLALQAVHQAKDLRRHQHATCCVRA